MLFSRSHKMRPLSIVALVLVLIVSQLSISANLSEKELSNDEVLPLVIDSKQSKVTVESLVKPYKSRVELSFNISDDMWYQIKQDFNPLLFKLPKQVSLTKLDSPTHTEKSLESKAIQDLTQIKTKTDNDGFSLDFKNVVENPVSFKLIYEVDIVGELQEVDVREFPAIGIVLPNLLDNIKELESQSETEVVPKVDVEQDENIPEEIENGENSGLPETTNKHLTGSIELNLKGKPHAKLRYQNKLIDASNPVKMDQYSDDSTQFSVDVFTDDNEFVEISYKLKLDEESLNKITEGNLIYDFYYMKDGKRSVYQYEYDFPKEMTLFTATQEQFVISDKLKDYSSSKIVRVDPLSNDGTFKLVVDELFISNEEAGIEDQYRFQDLIAYKLNDYITTEIKKGTSLETIKETLKEGFEFATDEYQFTGYSYKQMKKEELEKLEDYPLVIEDFIAPNNHIEEIFPVQPLGGVDHKLEHKGFNEISSGFELAWDGILNTSRNHTMNPLNLSFVSPKIVKDSGFKNWSIQTDVEVSYFIVKNDGTLEPYVEHPSESLHFENTSTTKIDDIKIPLVEKNLVVKYTVKQTYENVDLQLEIEGRQLGRMTSALEKNQLIRTADNEKMYPRSILITGEKREEAMPTSLIWNIKYNNNELVRIENDGFDFRINAKTIKAYSADSADEYVEIPATYENMKFKRTVLVNNKAIDKDGRFDLAWNAEGTEAQIRIKKDKKVTEPVVFSIIFENDIKHEYQSGKSIRDELMTSPSLMFKGDAEVDSFTNGGLIPAPKPTEEELKTREASNYLILLDKKPIMIDYRTKEVIWGASINTTTAHRVGLPGLSYMDKFGDGLEFEPMDDGHKILLFKVDPEKNSYREYDQFRNEVQKLMDDSELESIHIYDAVIKLLGEPMGDDENSQKTYGEVAELIAVDDMGYASQDKETLRDKDYIVSRPKANPSYVEKLKGIVINGDSDEAHQSDITKNDLTKDADLRVDFVVSDKAIGNGEGDANTYFIMYKTKLHSDKPLDKVSNLGQLIFASWVPGEGNKITWKGGGHVAKQDLGEVAKYNTIPKKEGVVKVVKDANTGRNRLGVEWTINFNYDIDFRRIDRVKMDVQDTIDKSFVSSTQENLQNAQLKLEEIEKLEFKAFEVDKEGHITEAKDVEGKPIVKEAIVGSEELKITEDANTISYHIAKEMNPKYVYQFKLITFIDTDDAPAQTITENKSEVGMDGNFTNKVAYDRALIPDGPLQGDVGEAEANAKFDRVARIKKQGIHDPQSGYRQQIKWILTLNETYEEMSEITIKDTLEKMHTFAFVDNDGELENLSHGKAELSGLKMEIFQSGSWRSIDKDEYGYTLTNLQGEEDLLDDWITGESGFIMSFSKTITDPIRITYATYGQVVSDTELPLINYADVSYRSNSGETINHKVQAEVNFNINNQSESYDEDRMDLGLSLRYNDNQLTSVEELEAGIPITGENVQEVIILLYRYQAGLPENNHIYRMGRPNKNGYIEFKDLEEGDYVVKQYTAAKGYSVPNSLGFVSKNRDKTKDLSEVIGSSQIQSKKLVTINLEKKTGLLDRLRGDTEVDKRNFAIYNTTPVFEVKNNAIRTDENLINTEVPFKNIDMKVTNDSNIEQQFTSNDDGIFKVGTVNVGDQGIDFGAYQITQPKQNLNGFLHNSESVSHTIKSNPNGTVDATTKNATYQNYLTTAELNVVKRNTTETIENSAFKLFKQDENKAWVPYDTIYSGNKTDDVYEVSNGKAIFYNLETGLYQLKQVSVDGKYLLNTEPLTFFAYGLDDLITSYEGKPTPMKLQFDNISMEVTILNKLGNQLIEGSEFILEKDGSNVEMFTISDETLGHKLQLGPGKYTLTQTKTTSNRPLNKKSEVFEIAEEQGDESTFEFVFMNHLGSVDIESYGPINTQIDIENLNIKGPNGRLPDGQRSDFGHGTYTIDGVELSSKWIYVDTEPVFEIPTSYEDPKELHKSVEIYGTQAELIYTNLDGDDSTVEPLIDGHFTLTNTTGQSVTTNTDQRFKQVEPGTYVVNQTKAPTGYGLNTDIEQTVTVPKSIKSSEVVINQQDQTVSYWIKNLNTFENYRGRVSLLKTSGEDGSVLEGVVFDLYKEDKLLIEGLKTNDQGVIDVDSLAPGNYYFVETSGDGQHTISSQHYAFEIASENGGPYATKDVGVKNYYANVIFKNTDPSHLENYTTGHFNLFEKTDSGWKAVPGYSDFTVETGKERFEIKGIKPNEYKLVQTQAPGQTIRNTYEYEFEVPTFKSSKSDDRVVIALDDFVNYQGSFSIAFVDETGPYRHEVEGTYGGNTPVIAKDGTLILNNLKPGKHALTFTETANAVVYDENVEALIPVEAHNDIGINHSATVRVIYGHIEVYLVDGSSLQPLDSGQYRVDDMTHEVSSEGSVTIGRIGPGEHKIVQTEAADNYILNLENKNFFTLPNRISELKDAKINSSGDFPFVELSPLIHYNYQTRVIIHKTDDHNVPLEGVKFALTQNNELTSALTNAEGIANFENVGPGWYSLTETATPRGYEGADDSYNFEVASSFAGKPDDYEFSVVNKRIEVLPTTGISSTNLMNAAVVITVGSLLSIYSFKRRKKSNKK